MFLTEDLYNKRLYGINKKGRSKKHGNLRAAVFHPSKPQLVGFIVKRPDLLLMFKRKDRFVAADAISRNDDGQYTAKLTQADAWDKAACKRLDISLDDCIIWVGMPVRSLEDEALGLISNVEVSKENLRVQSIDISESSASRAILGSADIPASKIKGYKNGAIVVDAAKDDVEVTGGVAAKAGEAWAKGSHAVTETTSKAAAATGEAINKGAFKTGQVLGQVQSKVDEAAAKREEAKEAARASGEGTASDKAAHAVGKQIGRAGGMFKAFKDEFDKASK